HQTDLDDAIRSVEINELHVPTIDMEGRADGLERHRDPFGDRRLAERLDRCLHGRSIYPSREGWSRHSARKALCRDGLPRYPGEMRNRFAAPPVLDASRQPGGYSHEQHFHGPNAGE